MFKNLTIERFLRFLVAVVLLTGIVWLLMNYSTLLAYAIIAILISYLLDPAVSQLESRGWNRTLAISLTLILVGLGLTWISTTIFPALTNQMVGLARQLTIENIRYISDQIESVLISNFNFIPENIIEENLTLFVNNAFDVNKVPDILSNVIGIFTNVFSALLVIPFATFFFLKDGSKIRRDLLQWIPNQYFETTLTVIDKIETRLGNYFKSVLVQSTIVAVMASVLLSIAGLNNALSVGIASGVANSIPYFGPIIGYILSISVSIIETGDFSLVLPCILAVLVVQVTDNVVLQPLLFSRSADMHPVAILFIILIGAETAGVLGMLIAIPIATTIKITVNQIGWSLKNYQVFKSEAGRTKPVKTVYPS